MNNKKKITPTDYLKANRSANRKEEIEAHGHPVCHKRVHKSRKTYDRKTSKAALKKLPFLFFAPARVAPGEFAV